MLAPAVEVRQEPGTQVDDIGVEVGFALCPDFLGMPLGWRCHVRHLLGRWSRDMAGAALAQRWSSNRGTVSGRRIRVDDHPRLVWVEVRARNPEPNYVPRYRVGAGGDGFHERISAI
jgi:hypothetical protein